MPGRATEFYIYQNNGGEWDFVEKRAIEPVCQDGRHSIEAMRENTARFADCKYVAASRIGTGAMSALQQQGVTPMSLPGDINEILEKIFTYNELQSMFPQN